MSGKARFVGKGLDRSKGWRFSESIQKEIRSIYRDRKINRAPEDQNPEKAKIEREKSAERKKAEDKREKWLAELGEKPVQPEEYFIASIEREAVWAKYQLENLAKEGVKEDVKAELASLLKRTTSLRDDFRSLSPDVDRLFTVENDPLAYADYLDGVCGGIEHAIDRSQKLPRKESLQASRRKIAVEFSIRLLRTAKEHGMKVTATAHPKDLWISDAVELLSCVGKSIGMSYAETTWRDIIIEAQKGAPDLKPQK